MRWTVRRRSQYSIRLFTRRDPIQRIITKVLDIPRLHVRTRELERGLGIPVSTIPPSLRATNYLSI